MITLSWVESEIEFQSTLPTRGETVIAVHGVGHRVISIHSPHTGRDPAGRLMVSAPPAFQSTLPTRGETCGGLKQ